MAARGMPDPASVVIEKPFTPRGAVAGPAAAITATRTILRTNEVDEYEEAEAAAPQPFAVTAVLEAVKGDNFTGHSRKAAKISLPDVPIKKFDDLKDLIDSLVDDDLMIHREPKIKDNETSRRVAEENRMVRVDAFLYAASREDDNDFHLIVGRDPNAAGQELYMTVELSGLPSSGAKAFAKLKSSRNSFKDFFADDLPGSKYDFHPDPYRVRIEGALFFDITHASGGRPGPKSLRPHMPTIWEIHPISKIEFFE